MSIAGAAQPTGGRREEEPDGHRAPEGAVQPPAVQPPTAKRDRTHFLYLAVIAAVIAGVVVGLAAPGFAVELKPVGTGFVNLIKMMISPVIFCTIVLGIGSVTKAAKVGRVGGLAIGYFLAMSTVALAIGLAVGNLLEPGDGLHLTAALAKSGHAQAAAGGAQSTSDFLLGMIPNTLLSALTEGKVLQTLLVALLVGFALQAMGPAGAPVLRGVEHVQRLVFRVMAMVMWVAPVGAFGAMAGVVGATGTAALKSLAVIMIGFYLTCALFVVVVLGALLRLVTGVNVFALLRYLGREFLLILSTSSSESALPRLIAKMEHLGVSRPVVGITVPTGYSFNLDGTAIYLTMASIFISEAMDKPMSIGEQLSLLVFMVIASKGAAGVTGAGLATLAGGLQSHKPALVDGVGLIVGIDRFMSEARALTNFAGNAVATVLIGRWTGEFDAERARRVLAGELPFDERTLIDTHDGQGGQGAAPAAASPVPVSTPEHIPAAAA
ncbi:cation:dicarboxylate symporter family transporter [Kitasatospora sp. NPDC001660]